MVSPVPCFPPAASPIAHGLLSQLAVQPARGSPRLSRTQSFCCSSLERGSSSRSSHLVGPSSPWLVHRLRLTGLLAPCSRVANVSDIDATKYRINVLPSAAASAPSTSSSSPAEGDVETAMRFHIGEPIQVQWEAPETHSYVPTVLRHPRSTCRALSLTPGLAHLFSQPKGLDRHLPSRRLQVAARHPDLVGRKVGPAPQRRVSRPPELSCPLWSDADRPAHLCVAGTTARSRSSTAALEPRRGLRRSSRRERLSSRETPSRGRPADTSSGCTTTVRPLPPTAIPPPYAFCHRRG